MKALLSEPYTQYTVSARDLSLEDNIIFACQSFFPCMVPFQILSSEDNQRNLIIMLARCEN